MNNPMQLFSIILSWFLVSIAQAGIPLWTFTPLTETSLTVPANSSAQVQYRVTNQSSKPHTLVVQPIQAITQITTGLGICTNPFTLRGHDSCILSLQVNGTELRGAINDGPIVCQQNTGSPCYRPSASNILHILPGAIIENATIAVTGSPLTLTVNGPTGQLTITNTSTDVTATNITSNFTGTALDGNVTETGNTCASVSPGSSCTLTYTPGGAIVPQTNFTIQGTNTNAISAAIAIESGSTLTGVSPSSSAVIGGTPVTLTGTGLTGATAVTFGGVAATSVTVVNSTTVTAVTPAHALGTVDVVISTPAGGATLVNGYTYIPSAVGLSAGGGIIACTNGGLDNLIAATADNSAGILWGSASTSIPGATSTTDGSSNTTAIVMALGTGNAAGVCDTYTTNGFTDWFLPAQDQLNCLYLNQVAIGGFSTGNYWSSTQDSTSDAWLQIFISGTQAAVNKGFINRVRCVRNY